MRGHYTLTLDSGNIPMRFCTYSISRFAEKFNLSFSDVVDLFATGKLGIHHIIQLLLSGAEYVCLKEAKAFQYNELDAAEWIDEMGGAFSPKLQEVLQEVVKSMSSEVAPGTTGESGPKKKHKLAGLL